MGYCPSARARLVHRTARGWLVKETVAHLNLAGEDPVRTAQRARDGQGLSGLSGGAETQPCLHGSTPQLELEGSRLFMLCTG